MKDNTLHINNLLVIISFLFITFLINNFFLQSFFGTKIILVVWMKIVCCVGKKIVVIVDNVNVIYNKTPEYFFNDIYMFVYVLIQWLSNTFSICNIFYSIRWNSCEVCKSIFIVLLKILFCFALCE